MSTRIIILVILLVGIVFTADAAAPAKSGHDPIIRLESSARLEVDLGMMVEDLMPILVEGLAAEGEENAELAEFLLNHLGFDALGLLKMEARQTKEKSTSNITITLDPEKKDGLIHRFYSTANGQCRFGEFVPKDELVMFMTLHNFSSYLETTLDFLAQPELAELLGSPPADENGDLVFGSFNLRNDLLPLLSGELDFFVLESSGDEAVSPFNSPFFLVLGSTDGFALRDRLFELGALSGMDLAPMMASVEAETIGDFEYRELPFGGALAVSDDYVVFALAPGSLRKMLAGNSGDLDVPDGIEWVYLDGSKCGVLMESMMGLASAFSSDETDETRLMMEIYSILFEHIETEEVLIRTRPGRLEIKTQVDGPIMTGLYELTYVMLQELPAVIERQRLENEAESELNEYQAAIHLVDKAMIAYAEDHHGVYPEDPEDLSAEGYLEFFPMGTRIAAGEFLEWGYSYLPLRDESGDIAGYFLFLFGGDEEDGFDVFTPENLSDTENFLIDRDGDADGVASFCYDGIAIDQIGDYWGE